VGCDGLVKVLRFRHVRYSHPEVVDHPSGAQIVVVNGLSAVSVGVEQEAPVVVVPVLGPWARSPVAAEAGVGAHPPELVHLGA
jgi:hypothetical protein